MDMGISDYWNTYDIIAFASRYLIAPTSNRNKMFNQIVIKIYESRIIWKDQNGKRLQCSAISVSFHCTNISKRQGLQQNTREDFAEWTEEELVTKSGVEILFNFEIGITAATLSMNWLRTTLRLPAEPHYFVNFIESS